MARFLFGEAGGKLSLIDNANQAQNLKPSYCENEVAVLFLYVTLEFVAESLALLIVHVISKLLDGGLHTLFGSYL